MLKGKDRILCNYLSRIADLSEVIPISFNALAQYKLALYYATECFMIIHFMIATKNSTSTEGINLPPVHGAEKAIDPSLKPESQSETQEILAKPTPITPGRKAANPTVGWTPSQTTISNKAR